jgi:hypothetical protein
MLEAAFVRDHLEEVREALARRGMKVESELAALVALESRRARAHP